jgi:pyrimidine operon attenuation protein/uracil phosphoribosyltransferase
MIPAFQPTLGALAQRLREVLAARSRGEPLLAGIRRGGVWVAEHLRAALAIADPIGEIDAGMFRDDHGRADPARPLCASRLPWDVQDRHVVLVDDVLATGRTVRAALEELLQFGRPASVTLAVLVERTEPGLRELPIAPDAVGARLSPGRGRTLKLRGPDPLFFELLGGASG